MLDKIWDARTFRILFTTLLFAMVLYFLHGARGTLTLFLFSVLFAYFLEPLVCRLEKPFNSRFYAVAALYAVLAVIAVVLGFLLGPALARDFRALLTILPNVATQLSSGEIITRLGARQHLSTGHLQQVHEYFLTHKNALATFAAGLASRLESPLSHFWWLILIPILSFFFLCDGPAIAAEIIDLGRTHEQKGTLSGIITDVNVMLGSYIRAQIILAALTAVCLTVVLALMRVPNALILGPLAGICEFVPVVGPAVASAVIWGLAILLGYPHILALFLVLGTWRVIQDYVNAPRVMGKQMEINPLATIFGVLAGGEIGGVIGALVAVPIVAILRILWRRMDHDVKDNTPASAQLRASQMPEKPRV